MEHYTQSVLLTRLGHLKEYVGIAADGQDMPKVLDNIEEYIKENNDDMTPQLLFGFIFNQYTQYLLQGRITRLAYMFHSLMFGGVPTWTENGFDTKEYEVADDHERYMALLDFVLQAEMDSEYDIA
jgi:hypothetical protein